MIRHPRFVLTRDVFEMRERVRRQLVEHHPDKLVDVSFLYPFDLAIPRNQQKFQGRRYQTHSVPILVWAINGDELERVRTRHRIRSTPGKRGPEYAGQPILALLYKEDPSCRWTEEQLQAARITCIPISVGASVEQIEKIILAESKLDQISRHPGLFSTSQIRCLDQIIGRFEEYNQRVNQMLTECGDRAQSIYVLHEVKMGELLRLYYDEVPDSGLRKSLDFVVFRESKDKDGGVNPVAVVEYDGRQHQNDEEVRRRDWEKEKLLKESFLPLIRVGAKSLNHPKVKKTRTVPWENDEAELLAKITISVLWKLTFPQVLRRVKRSIVAKTRRQNLPDVEAWDEEFQERLHAEIEFGRVVHASATNAEFEPGPMLRLELIDPFLRKLNEFTGDSWTLRFVYELKRERRWLGIEATKSGMRLVHTFPKVRVSCFPESWFRDPSVTDAILRIEVVSLLEFVVQSILERNYGYSEDDIASFMESVDEERLV